MTPQEELDDEAEEYVQNTIDITSPCKLTEGAAKFNGFIAGTNSKFVEKKIIQAQIDALNDVSLYFFSRGQSCPYINSKIQELKAQLK